MYKISARNVNDAFIEGLHVMRAIATLDSSRNGLVKVAPCPILTMYEQPWERVLFNRERDCNPFFHLAECIWMLSGSDDAKWISQFNSGMMQYSDDGSTLHGAYGNRWREWAGGDQLTRIITLLKKDRDSRRAVLTMWDPVLDLGTDSKDLPCNTHAYFRVRGNQLDMTVMCRSNDMIWGAYGANAVHFTFLQEFLASALGLVPGPFFQFSNNFHIYEKHWHWLDVPPIDETRYHYRRYPHVPLFRLTHGHADWGGFLKDCEGMVEGHAPVSNFFLCEVAAPMIQYYLARKQGHAEPAYLEKMPTCDWQVAAMEWVARREDDGSKPGRGYIDQG